MVPNDPCLLVLIIFVVPSYIVWSWSLKSIACGKSDGILLLRVLDAPSHSRLLNQSLWGKPVPMPTAWWRWRGAGGGRDWSPWSTVLGVSLEVDPPAPGKPDDCSSSWHPDCSPLGDAASEPTNKTLSSLTQRDYEIIRVCCFRPLHFGVMCYTAIENEYKPLDKWTERKSLKKKNINYKH